MYLKVALVHIKKILDAPPAQKDGAASTKEFSRPQLNNAFYFLARFYPSGEDGHTKAVWKVERLAFLV